ncbi:MAG TPA: NYN domain-containing protein [Bryobacterales bacterium]|nr:NYN domain-containing protein [Bryobacterales bacterium]
MDEKLKIAVFIDYDNIEIGVKSTLGREFDVSAVLEGLKERGEIVTKIAYANWGRQASATRALTEHGVQMVQRDPSPRGDKNGADINLALDALEMAFTRDHINTFTIVSGDSDFMALVEKLKQYNKRVFIVGGKAFTSTILQRNCHEFISYESLLDSGPARPHRGGAQPHRQPAVKRAEALPLEQALPLLDRALKALERREVKAQLGLMKSTMLQLDSAFTERDYGLTSFSDFVQKLAAAGHIRLHRREGNFVVERVEEHEEARPAPALTREDAIPLLRSVLEANQAFLSLGIPAKELAALFRAGHPGFNPQDYGFTEFEELLNLAQDKGLVRNEADPERGLRVFRGSELEAASSESEAGEVMTAEDAVPAEEEAAAGEAMQPAAAPARRAGRRRPARPRKSAGPRRRLPRSRKPETPAPAAQP